MRKIYSSCTRKHRTKALSSLSKMENKGPTPSSKKINTISNHDKFFDLDYMFFKPLPIKKCNVKRFQVNNKNHQPLATSQTSACLKKDGDPRTKDRSKHPKNNMFFGLSSFKSTQIKKSQRIDLSFRQNSQFQSIHQRKYHCNNHHVSNKNIHLKSRQTINVDDQPLQQCLTTRTLVNETQRLTISQQLKHQQPSQKAKKLQEKKGNMDLQTLLVYRRRQWLQSEQFKTYYSKQIQNARRAFMDKNKQTIKIYRPWSPTAFEFQQAENLHF